MRVRNWCFTLNNYTQEEISSLKQLQCRYMVCGFEKGKTQTPHIQGYVEFTKSMRFNAVRKLIPRSHLEARRASRMQAREYCMKEGDYFEIGTFVENGCRTDLQEIQNEIMEGRLMRDIATDHFSTWVHSYRALDRFASMYAKKDIRDVTVEVYYGAPGSGKTYKAFTENPDNFILTNITGRDNETPWFDTYNGESTLIIDDFDEWIPYKFLLRLLDVYPLVLPIKGSTTFARYTKVIITANEHPSHWYRSLYVHYQDSPLFRRIHRVVEMTTLYKK